MHRLRSAVFVLVLGCMLATFALSQSAPRAEAASPELVSAAVLREFGSHFTLVSKFPPMFGDFDADGAEDLAVVATGEPMLGQGDYNYKIVDPYDSFFGYGNPKIMMSFPVHASEHAVYVLIIHDWRAAHPKAKFVIANLPFDQIQVNRAQWKKKKISALFATDSTGLRSQLFWDGHKYRWEPVGAD